MTDPPTPYVSADEAKIAEAWEAGLISQMQYEEATFLRITADIEWQGDSRGVRTVRFGPMELDRVRLANDLRAESKVTAERTPPAATYRQSTFGGKLRALMRSDEGYSRVNFSMERLTNLITGDMKPTRAEVNRVNEAHQWMADKPIRHAWQEVEKRTHEFTNALSDALKDSTGVDIRLFDIRNIEFE